MEIRKISRRTLTASEKAAIRKRIREKLMSKGFGRLAAKLNKQRNSKILRERIKKRAALARRGSLLITARKPKTRIVAKKILRPTRVASRIRVSGRKPSLRIAGIRPVRSRLVKVGPRIVSRRAARIAALKNRIRAGVPSRHAAKVTLASRMVATPRKSLAARRALISKNLSRRPISVAKKVQTLSDEKCLSETQRTRKSLRSAASLQSSRLKKRAMVLPPIARYSRPIADRTRMAKLLREMRRAVAKKDPKIAKALLKKANEEVTIPFSINEKLMDEFKELINKLENIVKKLSESSPEKEKPEPNKDENGDLLEVNIFAEDEEEKDSEAKEEVEEKEVEKEAEEAAEEEPESKSDIKKKQSLRSRLEERTRKVTKASSVVVLPPAGKVSEDGQINIFK